MSRILAVGVDGSDVSLVALRWALQAGRQPDDELIAVIADDPAHRSPDGAGSADEVRNTITRIAAGAPLRIEIIDGTPLAVLLSITGRVDLLIVGGQGYGGWRAVMSTSVTGKLAIRTKAALCVVREIPPLRNRLVVGYDGPGSASAVGFAVAEAIVRDASLTIASSWHYPVRDTRAASPETAGLLEESASAALAPVVDEIRSANPGLSVSTEIRFGQPVEVLADLAGSADLVVVGSHGRGELATLVVGSVALGLLQRVRTPVVIVPHG
jgi:nucleotide-binding universal stress UspA family protein